MESTFDNEGQVEISSGTWELSGDGGSTGTFTLDAGTSLELNKFYGIPYTVNQNGAFVSSPQIIGGDASNVTLIDGSDSLPKPLGSNDGDSATTSPYYVLLRHDRRRHGQQSGHDQRLADHHRDADRHRSHDLDGRVHHRPGDAHRGRWAPARDGPSAISRRCSDGVTLINESTLTLTDQDAFAQQDGATVENEILHTIDIQGDGTWSGDGTETIDNQGTFEKTAGSGTTTGQYIALVNDGIVTVSSGTLDLEGGGTATGNFTADAQTTLEFGHFPGLSTRPPVSAVRAPWNSLPITGPRSSTPTACTTSAAPPRSIARNRSISSPAATSKTWGP